MVFEQTAFAAKAGTEVALTFNNTATSVATANNVVLLTDNSDATINWVGQAEMQASATAYVPNDDAILAGFSTLYSPDYESVNARIERHAGCLQVAP